MKLLRDTWLVFGRYFGLLIHNPVWIALGVLQPLLYLILFAPLLKPIASMRGFGAGGFGRVRRGAGRAERGQLCPDRFHIGASDPPPVRRPAASWLGAAVAAQHRGRQPVVIRGRRGAGHLQRQPRRSERGQGRGDHGGPVGDRGRDRRPAVRPRGRLTVPGRLAYSWTHERQEEARRDRATRTS